MFSRTGRKLSSLREIHQWWTYQPEGQQMITEFITRQLPPTVSARETCSPEEQAALQQSNPTLSHVTSGSDNTNIVRATASTTSKEISLPLSATQKFCLSEAFLPVDFQSMDINHALTGLDYLTDAEYGRRKCLREAAQRLNITQDTWLDVLMTERNTDAFTWVQLIQAQELDIQRQYARIFVTVRIWTMLHVLDSPVYSTAARLAMLNTLFPPEDQKHIEDSITERVLKTYRDAFLQHIVAGSQVYTTDLIAKLSAPSSDQRWNTTRNNVHLYLELCEQMVEQCKVVYGVQFFHQSNHAHTSTDSNLHARADSKNSTPLQAGETYWSTSSPMSRNSRSPTFPASSIPRSFLRKIQFRVPNSEAAQHPAFVSPSLSHFSGASGSHRTVNPQFYTHALNDSQVFATNQDTTFRSQQDQRYPSLGSSPPPRPALKNKRSLAKLVSVVKGLTSSSKSTSNQRKQSKDTAESREAVTKSTGSLNEVEFIPVSKTKKAKKTVSWATSEQSTRLSPNMEMEDGFEKTSLAREIFHPADEAVDQALSPALLRNVPGFWMNDLGAMKENKGSLKTSGRPSMLRTTRSSSWGKSDRSGEPGPTTMKSSNQSVASNRSYSTTSSSSRSAGLGKPQILQPESQSSVYSLKVVSPDLPLRTRVRDEYSGSPRPGPRSGTESFSSIMPGGSRSSTGSEQSEANLSGHPALKTRPGHSLARKEAHSLVRDRPKLPAYSPPDGWILNPNSKTDGMRYVLEETIDLSMNQVCADREKAQELFEEGVKLSMDPATQYRTIQNFEEALRLWPTFEEARIGLAQCLRVEHGFNLDPQNAALDTVEGKSGSSLGKESSKRKPGSRRPKADFRSTSLALLKGKLRTPKLEALPATRSVPFTQMQASTNAEAVRALAIQKALGSWAGGTASGMNEHNQPPPQAPLASGSRAAAKASGINKNNRPLPLAPPASESRAADKASGRGQENQSILQPQQPQQPQKLPPQSQPQLQPMTQSPPQSRQQLPPPPPLELNFSSIADARRLMRSEETRETAEASLNLNETERQLRKQREIEKVRESIRRRDTSPARAGGEEIVRPRESEAVKAFRQARRLRQERERERQAERERHDGSQMGGPSGPGNAGAYGDHYYF